MGGHTEWVSCVRFSPSVQAPVIVSCGWDKLVKVCSLTNCKLRTNLYGHAGYLNTVTVSPDGSLCASGGKDGTAMLWDLNEGKRLYSLDAGDIIHSLVFSPNRYWLCAATTLAIKIWDLESKVVVDELKPEFPAMGKNATAPYCTSGMIISASRDKTCLVCTLTNAGGDGEAYGYPRRALKGHSHFVSDVVISSDGQFALSGSWDGTLRLWELATGKTTRRFSATPRTSSRSPSRRTTARSSRGPATRP